MPARHPRNVRESPTPPRVETGSLARSSRPAEAHERLREEGETSPSRAVTHGQRSA